MLLVYHVTFRCVHVLTGSRKFVLSLWQSTWCSLSIDPDPHTIRAMRGFPMRSCIFSFHFFRAFSSASASRMSSIGGSTPSESECSSKSLGDVVCAGAGRRSARKTPPFMSVPLSFSLSPLTCMLSSRESRRSTSPRTPGGKPSGTLPPSLSSLPPPLKTTRVPQSLDQALHVIHAVWFACRCFTRFLEAVPHQLTRVSVSGAVMGADIVEKSASMATTVALLKCAIPKIAACSLHYATLKHVASAET